MKYLLFFSLSLIIVGFIQYQRSESFNELSSQKSIPSPEELWKEQQSIKKQSFITGEKLKLGIISKKTTIRENTASINKLEQTESEPNSLLSNIPSPDELWLLQQKENRELDVLATIPDMPVISDEQLEAESAENLQTEESNETESLFNNPLEGFSDINEEEVLAVESSKEVIPFELRELEALISNDGDSQDATEELTEPLIDPETGISDKELMQAQDIDPPIEPEFLAN